MGDTDRNGFRLDLRDERLWHGDSRIPLTRKAFDLLRFCAANRNRLLTKEEIRENLWPSVHVTEALIKEYVHDLRVALGDDPRNPSFIETVRGRGYRFIGDLQVTDGDEPDLANYSGADRPSLALVPLDNLTGQERCDALCRGITDDLITELSRFPEFAVRAASLGPPGGRLTWGLSNRDLSLPARYALRGSLQATGGSLRANLHLLRTSCGSALWAQRFEFRLQNLQSGAADLVARVVSALGAIDGPILRDEIRTLARKRPDELTPRQLYLLGFYLEEQHEKESVLRGYELLQRAVKLDPELPKAWIALGWCCYQISHDRWEARPQEYARMHCESHLNAWRLNPTDPQVAMNAIDLVNRDNMDSLCETYERAADVGWNDAELLAEAAKYIALTVDDAERGLQLLSRSAEIKPRCSAGYFMHTARVCYAAGDFDGALAAVQRAPDIAMVRVFELLSLAQLDRRTDLSRRRAAFARRYPDFDLHEFIRDQPIMRGRARARFIVGVERAGLH